MWGSHFVSSGDYGPDNCQHQIVGKKSVSKTYLGNIDAGTLIPLPMPFQNSFHYQWELTISQELTLKILICNERIKPKSK